MKTFFSFSLLLSLCSQSFGAIVMYSETPDADGRIGSSGVWTAGNLAGGIIDVKHDSAGSFTRVGGFNFDSTDFQDRLVTSASISFTSSGDRARDGGNTDGGNFNVWGLVDGFGDETLTTPGFANLSIDSNPASPTHDRPVTPGAVLLGSISVPFGTAAGTQHTLTSPALLEFLNRDTNGDAAFLLSRVEAPSDYPANDNIVHQFTSGTANLMATHIPEPSRAMLLAVACAGLALRRRR